jgi:hypothetical protein
MHFTRLRLGLALSHVHAAHQQRIRQHFPRCCLHLHQSSHAANHIALPTGHSGTSSCAFSSDRGTFTALADGSTTVMDAVTTGQMVTFTTARRVSLALLE